MNSFMFTCAFSHLIGLQVGRSGTVVEMLLSHREFPCCLVGGRLDSVEAVVCLVLLLFLRHGDFIQERVLV
jgi:hypothetical protein